MKLLKNHPLYPNLTTRYNKDWEKSFENYWFQSLAFRAWPPGQGRSTVKGRMGHVSTSFCKSRDNFDRFWEHTLKESKELRIEDPKLKRKEKIPKKIANFIHQD